MERGERADLTLAEAATLLDPPLTPRQLRAIIAALGWQPTGRRPRTHGRGRPISTYPAGELLRLHAALTPWLGSVTPGDFRA